MKFTRVFTKRAVLIALTVVVVAVLGALLLFPNSARENASFGPDDTGHAKEAPTLGAAVNTHDGTAGKRLSDISRGRFYL